MIKPTLAQIQKAIEKKKYLWFVGRPNIGGIRTNDNTPDKFNDFIYIEYKGVFKVFNGTTDPGVYWLKNPMRMTGTFILPPGQYIDKWKEGIHHTYEALVLDGLIAGWRDNNKDNLLNPDKNKIYSDGQAVNIHHAHENKLQTVVDKYSAGCQVIQNITDWFIFFGIYKSSKSLHYSYTLLTEDDFKL